MHIAEAEQEAVLNWVPHKAKKKNQGNAPAQADDAQSNAAPLSALGDVASSSSSCLCPSQSLLPPPPPNCQVSPRQRPLVLSDPVPVKALGNATRRGGTKPNESFSRSAPAETPPPPPQRGSFSRTSKQKSIHFFFQPPTRTKPQEFFSQTNRGARGNKRGEGRGEGGGGQHCDPYDFLLGKDEKALFCGIHTSVPPNPQTHNPPGGMHVVVVGRAQAPPTLGTPSPPTAEIPPYTPQPPPPPSFDR